MLYDVQDSSISIMTLGNLRKNNGIKSESKISDINEIILRESHRKHKYGLLALGTGLIGAVLEYIAISEDEFKYSSSIFKPVFGFVIGSVPLLIIGSQNVNLPINRNIIEYKRSKENLRALSVSGKKLMKK